MSKSSDNSFMDRVPKMMVPIAFRLAVHCFPGIQNRYEQIFGILKGIDVCPKALSVQTLILHPATIDFLSYHFQRKPNKPGV